MKILLLVVTRDYSLRQFVGKKKHSAFPREAFNRGFLAEQKVHFVANAEDVGKFATPDDLEAFVGSRIGDADSLVLLIDQERANLARYMRSAALVCEIDIASASKNYQNYLHGRLSKLARVIDYLTRHFNDGKNSELLSLPLRNFKCSALADLKNQIAEDPCNWQVANSCIDTCLQTLRRRIRPRKNTSYRTKYAVDDIKRFFVFGNEHHALPDTGPPHRYSCKVSSCFRFGCRIDDKRHYNVSEGDGDKTRISGEFMDCHDDKHVVTGVTHINMFSNDFFG